MFYFYSFFHIEIHFKSNTIIKITVTKIDEFKVKPIICLSYNSTGDFIVTSAWDKNITIINSNPNKKDFGRVTIQIHLKEITSSLTFNKTDNYLFLGSLESETINIYEIDLDSNILDEKKKSTYVHSIKGISKEDCYSSRSTFFSFRFSECNKYLIAGRGSGYVSIYC